MDHRRTMSMDSRFDPRMRSKVSLKSKPVLTTSLSNTLLSRLLISNLTLVFALLLTKEWILDEHVSTLWLAFRVFGCGCMGALGWAIIVGEVRETTEVSTLGGAAFLAVVQQVAVYTIVQRVSAVRALILIQSSTFLLDSVLNVAASRRFLISILCLTLMLLSSAHYSLSEIPRFLPAFIALVVHGISTNVLETTWKHMEPIMGKGFAYASTTGLAFVISGLLYGLGRGSGIIEESPVLPMSTFLPIPFIAVVILYSFPNANRTAKNNATVSYTFFISLLSITAFAVIFGTLAFHQAFSLVDVLVAGMLLYASASDKSATGISTSSVSRIANTYLKTILSNPESRKIFYFLMLNLSYMGVQVVYGIITNSLGLISDAIHMAFDCMAIAMGLFASVAATWMPNEQYTYGYGRIETLSGFANGIFLLLISVFIVFEAIQRLMDPPEMNTNQLLLVSSLGLAVNLFGMFAMGGHHHHGGHSHSHGGGHSHSSHSHSSPTDTHTPHIEIEHEDDHSHSHSHSTTHSHSHSHTPSEPLAHSHSHHTRSLSVSLPPPMHSHSHSPGHDHDHSDHSHSHSHSHSPPPATGHRRTLSVALPSSSSPHINGVNGHQHHGHSPISPHSPSSPSAPRSPAHTHRRTASHLDVLEISRPNLHLQPPFPSDLGSHEEHDTPLTPGYQFGQDDHFKEHHANQRVPNLHDHAHKVEVHEGHSHNMRGVFLHVMADTLGSVGVIISTLLIQFYGWTGFDPIASLFIAILIAASVIPLVIDTGRILALDPAERDQDIKGALMELKSIPGLKSYTQARFWPKDASTLIGSIHIQLQPVQSADPTGPHSGRGASYAAVDGVLREVDEVLRARIKGLVELAIQVERGH